MKIPLRNLDNSKVDNKSLTFLVIEEKKYPKELPSCRLANFLFQIEHICEGSSIKVLKSVIPKLLKLDNVDDAYQGLSRVRERVASRHISLLGGKGFQKCACEGKFAAINCYCRKTRCSYNEHCHKDKKKS